MFFPNNDLLILSLVIGDNPESRGSVLDLICIFRRGIKVFKYQFSLYSKETIGTSSSTVTAKQSQPNVLMKRAKKVFPLEVL